MLIINGYFNMEKFITSYLMGGLANQMFQISKAKTEGFINNIPVYFEPKSFTPMDGNEVNVYVNNIFRNIVFKINLTPQKRFDEPSFSYNNVDYSYDTSVMFNGYYQSSKNFKNYSENIKNLFLPTEEFKEKLMIMYPLIFEKNSVSIHIRRGDYLRISDILPVIDKSYIDKALKYIGKYSNVFVFTNDKDWAEKNLDYDKCTIVTDLDDYEDLWAISLCNHNIMSNSSFSWWGSYLNENKDKKVCVPSIWFGPNGEKKYEDIYEPEWKKINVIYDNGFLK
jgi:hypothetical protein